MSSGYVPLNDALKTPKWNAVGQCQKCFAIQTYDEADYILKVPLVHNPQRCGGRLKLFQETRNA